MASNYKVFLKSCLNIPMESGLGGRVVSFNFYDLWPPANQYLNKSDQFESLTCICFLVESCLLFPEAFPPPLHLIYLMIFKNRSENPTGSFTQCKVLYFHVYIYLIVCTQPDFTVFAILGQVFVLYSHKYQKLCYPQS